MLTVWPLPKMTITLTMKKKIMKELKKTPLIRLATVRLSKRSMKSFRKCLIKLWMMPTLDLSISRNLIQQTKENKTEMILLMRLEF